MYDSRSRGTISLTVISTMPRTTRSGRVRCCPKGTQLALNFMDGLTNEHWSVSWQKVFLKPRR